MRHRTSVRSALYRFKYPLIFDQFRVEPWEKYGSNPILTKGTTGTWDSKGIRDPNWLIDTDGYLVTEGGQMIMYYSGYQDTGEAHYRRSIGRVTSPDGISLTKYGSNPVLQKGAPGAWDEFGVQLGNVVKRGAGDYIMVYSGVNDAWSTTTSWRIGIATSSDGLSWTKYASNPVLAVSDFSGISGNNILTFPYMIQLVDDTWAMILAGTFGALDEFRFYGATSNDALSWTPLNSGNPILTPSGSSWHSDNVEGPRLYEVAANKYLLTYHGDPGGSNYERMKAGASTSVDLINWTRYGGNPILSFGADTEWDDFKVENIVLAKDDFGSGTVRMWFSASGATAQPGDGFGYATSNQSFVGYT